MSTVATAVLFNAPSSSFSPFCDEQETSLLCLPEYDLRDICVVDNMGKGCGPLSLALSLALSSSDSIDPPNVNAQDKNSADAPTLPLANGHVGGPSVSDMPSSSLSHAIPHSSRRPNDVSTMSDEDIPPLTSHSLSSSTPEKSIGKLHGADTELERKNVMESGKRDTSNLEQPLPNGFDTKMENGVTKPIFHDSQPAQKCGAIAGDASFIDVDVSDNISPTVNSGNYDGSSKNATMDRSTPSAAENLIATQQSSDSASGASTERAGRKDSSHNRPNHQYPYLTRKNSCFHSLGPCSECCLSPNLKRILVEVATTGRCASLPWFRSTYSHHHNHFHRSFSSYIKKVSSRKSRIVRLQKGVTAGPTALEGMVDAAIASSKIRGTAQIKRPLDIGAVTATRLNNEGCDDFYSSSSLLLSTYSQKADSVTSMNGSKVRVAPFSGSTSQSSPRQRQGRGNRHYPTKFPPRKKRKNGIHHVDAGEVGRHDGRQKKRDFVTLGVGTSPTATACDGVSGLTSSSIGNSGHFGGGISTSCRGENSRSSSPFSSGSVGGRTTTSGSEMSAHEDESTSHYECDSEGTSATTNSELSWSERRRFMGRWRGGNRRRGLGKLRRRGGRSGIGSLHDGEEEDDDDYYGDRRIYSSLREALRYALEIVIDHEYEVRGGYMLSPAEKKKVAAMAGTLDRQRKRQTFDNSQPTIPADDTGENFLNASASEAAFRERKSRLIAMLSDTSDSPGKLVNVPMSSDELTPSSIDVDNAVVKRVANATKPPIDITSSSYVTLNGGDGPPFTIQRLAELLATPERYYTQTHKLCNALEKLLLVTSPSSAFGGSKGGESLKNSREDMEMTALKNERVRDNLEVRRRHLKRRMSSLSEVSDCTFQINADGDLPFGKNRGDNSVTRLTNDTPSCEAVETVNMLNNESKLLVMRDVSAIEPITSDGGDAIQLVGEQIPLSPENIEDTNGVLYHSLASGSVSQQPDGEPDHDEFGNHRQMSDLGKATSSLSGSSEASTKAPIATVPRDTTSSPPPPSLALDSQVISPNRRRCHEEPFLPVVKQGHDSMSHRELASARHLHEQAGIIRSSSPDLLSTDCAGDSREDSSGITYLDSGAPIRQARVAGGGASEDLRVGSRMSAASAVRMEVLLGSSVANNTSSSTGSCVGSGTDVADLELEQGRSSASNSDVDSESGDNDSLDDSASDRSDGSDSGSGIGHYEPFTAARVMALNRIQQQQQQRREQYLQSRALAALTTSGTSYQQSDGFRPPPDSEYQSGDSIDSMKAHDSGESDSSSSDVAD